MLFGWVNKLDTAVLTASGLVANLPVQNLQVNPLSRVARITGTSMTIDFDVAAATDWRVLGLLPGGQGGDVSDAATKRLTLSNTAAGNTDVYDSGTVSAGTKAGLREVWFVLDSALSARYGRLTVSDASKSFLDFGRLLGFGGAGFWEPSKKHALGYQLQVLDTTQRVRADSGALHRRVGTRTRALGFQLGFVSKTEMYANALVADQEAGLAGSLLVMLDPTNYLQEESVWGPVREEALPPLINTAPIKHSKAYTVEMER